MNFDIQAKLNGFEWCKSCNGWKLYEADGTCRDCGKHIFTESTADMIAEQTRKGYILP